MQEADAPTFSPSKAMLKRNIIALESKNEKQTETIKRTKNKLTRLQSDIQACRSRTAAKNKRYQDRLDTLEAAADATKQELRDQEAALSKSLHETQDALDNIATLKEEKSLSLESLKKENATAIAEIKEQSSLMESTLTNEKETLEKKLATATKEKLALAAALKAEKEASRIVIAKLMKTADDNMHQACLHMADLKEKEKELEEAKSHAKVMCQSARQDERKWTARQVTKGKVLSSFLILLKSFYTYTCRNYYYQFNRE